MQRILGVFLFAVVFANGAEAQELTLGVTTYAPFGLDDLDGKLPVSAEVRVTLRISEKFALEPFVTAGTTNWAVGRRMTEGFYGLQVASELPTRLPLSLTVRLASTHHDIAIPVLPLATSGSG